ncbi:MAG: hypothetical protein ACPIOQ_16995 [Promethearchaeia archaeon]
MPTAPLRAATQGHNDPHRNGHVTHRCVPGIRAVRAAATGRRARRWERDAPEDAAPPAVREGGQRVPSTCSDSPRTCSGSGPYERMPWMPSRSSVVMLLAETTGARLRRFTHTRWSSKVHAKLTGAARTLKTRINTNQWRTPLL